MPLTEHVPLTELTAVRKLSFFRSSQAGRRQSNQEHAVFQNCKGRHRLGQPQSVSRILKSLMWIKANQKSGRVIQKVCTLSSCPTRTANGRMKLLTSLGLPWSHWAGVFCPTAFSLYHRDVCKQEFRHVYSTAIREDRSTFSTKKATLQLSVTVSRVSKKGFPES